MTAKQKSEDMFNSNYMLITEYGEDYGEECLVSLLSIKFAIKECESIIKNSINFYEKEYYRGVINHLRKK